MASRTLTFTIDANLIKPYPAEQPDADRHRDGFPHNAIAHPLLVLAPPIGRWLHAHTEPVVPTWSLRWSRALDRIGPLAVTIEE